MRFFCKDPRNNAIEAGFKASPDEGGAARASTPVIEAFLYQMLEQNRQLFSIIPTSLFQSETPVDLKDVLEMFRQILDNHRNGHVLLIIDGLDECDEIYIKELLGYLDVLVRDSFARKVPKTTCFLKVLITCQPIGPIPFWSCRYTSIHIQLQDVDQDIARYIKDEMQDIARSRNFDDQLREDTEGALLKLANRMFLWVYFILQELRQIPVVSRATIVSVITSFPQDLHEYYEKTLARIVRAPRDALSPEQNPGMILLVIVFSLGGMTTREVAEILAISEDRPSRQSMVDYINSDIRTLVETQLSPLVVVDDDLIVIAHYSIYQYLEGFRPMQLHINNRNIAFDPDNVHGHVIMAELCLRYLLLSEFSENPNSVNAEWKVLEKELPFLAYATFRWYIHVDRAGHEVKQLLPLLRRFLDVRSVNYQRWEKLYFGLHQKTKTDPVTPILSILVRLDLGSVYKSIHRYTKRDSAPITPNIWRRMTSSWLSQHTEDRDSTLMANSLHERDRRGFMALHVASMKRSDTWLGLLIDAGADVFARTADDLSALHVAALSDGSTACAKMLLKHKHPVDEINRIPRKRLEVGVTPLMLAAATGNSGVATLLLEHKAKVDPDVPEDRRPLLLAARRGHEDTALRLLQYGPNLALHDTNSNNLLHIAANNGLFLLAKQMTTDNKVFDVDEVNEYGETPLHFAAKCGHERVVAMLLSFGASLELKRDYGPRKDRLNSTKTIRQMSPLELAVRNNHTSTALLLLKKGAKWHIDSDTNLTLLHIAAEWGNILVFKALQEAGMDINQATTRGQTPLFLATKKQNVPLVGYILSLDPDVNSGLNPTLWTPLHMAAFGGWSEIAKMLLEHGADPGARTSEGSSTILLAASANQPKVMELLLRHRPDLLLDSNRGTNALYTAVESRAVDCVSLLQRQGLSELCTRKDGWQPLHRAACNGELETLNLLLDAKADVNARTSSGFTALMIACQYGNEDAMDELIKRGADLSRSTTGDGLGLLHLAAASGKLIIMKTVLELNDISEIDRPTVLGETPFLIACKCAGIETMQALLTKKVDPQRLTGFGNNAFHFAVLSASLAKVRFLLNLHVPFEMRNASHDSPLDLACEGGHTDIAKHLISLGADFQKVNKYSGETCLHRCARYGRNETLNLLIAKGVELEIYDRRCLTPLLRAIIHFRRSTTQLLVAAGADIDAYDSLGRTAFNIIIEQYHSHLNEQQAPSALTGRLRAVILASIEHARTRNFIHEMDISHLARNLLRAQDYSNASRAYLTVLTLPDPLVTSPEDVRNDRVSIEHGATCDNCRPRRNIIGARYKCLVCSDLDLCSSCKKLYDRGGTGLSVCRNHSFFEIPNVCADLHMMIFEKEKYLKQTLAWLDELHAKYSTMPYSSLHDYGEVSPGDAENPASTTWMHHLCGLEVFHIKSIWAYREASSSITDAPATRTDAENIFIIGSQD